jgi:predicted transcriptional regulator
MKNISLKLDDHIFSETENILLKLKKPRNRYINEAIDQYNKYQRRKLLQKRLSKESEMVRDDSMRILRDFEEIDYGGETV